MTGESGDRIGNWGRWGDNDERGALNFITSEVLKSALATVKQGKVYSLSIPLRLTNVPIASDAGRRVGCVHLMRTDGGDFAVGARRGGRNGVEMCDDYLFLASHGTTHIDALCHVWTNDKIYGGFSGNTIRSTGARYCGIDKAKWIITRGVLLDITRYKGVDILDKDYVITAADLDGCAKSEGVDCRSGDVLLFRTGSMNAYQKDPQGWEDKQPGIGVDTLPWIVEREICAVGSDNAAVEAWPSEDPSVVTPVHVELLRNQGVYLMELLYLDDLAKDRVYEFLFMIAPLNITGGTGSPLSPLAVV